jgi:hypothetical protein
MISPIHPIFPLWAILSLFGSGTSLSRFDNNAVVKAEDGTHDPRKGNVPCTFSEQGTKRKWRVRCHFRVKVSDLHKVLGPKRNCGDCGRTTWTSGRTSRRLGRRVVCGFPLLQLHETTRDYYIEVTNALSEIKRGGGARETGMTNPQGLASISPTQFRSSHEVYSARLVEIKNPWFGIRWLASHGCKTPAQPL